MLCIVSCCQWKLVLTRFLYIPKSRVDTWSMFQGCNIGCNDKGKRDDRTTTKAANGSTSNQTIHVRSQCTNQRSNTEKWLAKQHDRFTTENIHKLQYTYRPWWSLASIVCVVVQLFTALPFQLLLVRNSIPRNRLRLPMFDFQYHASL